MALRDRVRRTAAPTPTPAPTFNTSSLIGAVLAAIIAWLTHQFGLLSGVAVPGLEPAVGALPFGLNLAQVFAILCGFISPSLLSQLSNIPILKQILQALQLIPQTTSMVNATAAIMHEVKDNTAATRNDVAELKAKFDAQSAPILPAP